MPADDRIHLIVLYGGQSAEHDVSCTTAAHVLRAADPSRYRITPIGISRDGTWAIDQAAQTALAAGPAHLPGRLDPVGPGVSEVSATPFLSGAVEATGDLVVAKALLHKVGREQLVHKLALALVGRARTDDTARLVQRNDGRRQKSQRLAIHTHIAGQNARVDALQLALLDALDAIRAHVQPSVFALAQPQPIQQRRQASGGSLFRKQSTQLVGNNMAHWRGD